MQKFGEKHYLKGIRQYLCNNNPDHTSSSKARTERQELVKCISTYERRHCYNRLETNMPKAIELKMTKLIYNYYFIDMLHKHLTDLEPTITSSIHHCRRKCHLRLTFFHSPLKTKSNSVSFSLASIETKQTYQVPTCLTTLNIMLTQEKPTQV